VINEPRIRFYAGYPLTLDDGSCIGTLCLLDTRPRTLEGPDLERLHDLADIASREILGLTTRWSNNDVVAASDQSEWNKELVINRKIAKTLTLSWVP
jgi:GAF domain